MEYGLFMADGTMKAYLHKPSMQGLDAVPCYMTKKPHVKDEAKTKATKQYNEMPE
jgi:hypothetical protein